MSLRPPVRRLRDRLVAVAAGPGDEVRRQFDVWIASLPGRLETSPELRERRAPQVRGPGQRRAAGLVLPGCGGKEALGV